MEPLVSQRIREKRVDTDGRVARLDARSIFGEVHAQSAKVMREIRVVRSASRRIRVCTRCLKSNKIVKAA